MIRFRAVAPLALVAACAAAPKQSVDAPSAAAAPSVAPAPPPAAQHAFRETPDAPFRASAPRLVGTSRFDIPSLRALRLKNGVPVYFVKRESFQFLRLTVMAKGEVSASERPGAREIMAAAIDAGTPSLASSDLVTGAFLREFADLGEGEDDTSVTVSLGTRAENADATIALLADVVRNPTFPASAIDHYRAQFTAERAHDTRGAVYADRALCAALFPAPSLGGVTRDGRPLDLSAITRDDVVRLHQTLFDPRAISISVAGDIEEAALLEILNRAFGSWTPPPGPTRRAALAPPAARVARSRAAPATAPRLIVLDRPDAPAVQLAAGSLASDARDDWWRVLATRGLLTDSGRGRLARALHDGALASSVSSDIAWRREGILLKVRAELPLDRAAAGVRVTRDELRRFADEGPGEADLADEKSGLTRALPAWFETNSQVVNALRGVAYGYETPSSFGMLRPRIDAVTAADVQRVARRAFDPSGLVYVVVGDWSRLKDDVTPLGWSAVEVFKQP